jgi:hypothetical protein
LYLRLEPVLTAAIESAGVAGRRQEFYPTARQTADGASSSAWMAIAARDADLAFLAPEKRWQNIRPQPGGKPWTDDFSNIISAIRW